MGKSWKIIINFIEIQYIVDYPLQCLIIGEYTVVEIEILETHHVCNHHELS